MESTLTFTIDAELLRQFEALCAEQGLTVEDAIVLFVRQCVREQRLPFDITPNEEALEANEGP